MEDIEKKPEKSGKPRIWLRVLLIIASYVLFAVAVTSAIDARHVRFYMSDAQDITLDAGEAYDEPGIYAVSNGRLFGEGHRRLRIRAESNVDISQPGEYEISYTVRYRFRDYSTTRRIIVNDTPPVIDLKCREGYRPSWLTGYEEEGYTAYDASDGDLTDMVERTVIDDRIIYTVTDSTGNTVSVERKPDYSIARPDILFEGDDHLQIFACPEFSDPGCKAMDSLGNDLTEYIQTEGSVIPYKPGEYELCYSICNAQGDTVSRTRYVSVLPAPLPDTIQPDERTIYLTFDDGPGPYTEQLLDVLADYNVKATFFVTCLNDKYADMIGRAYSEGHSIGVHTASHNYYGIYSSEQDYFRDFEAAQDLIYAQTGTYSNIFRFPGGSSNTVSNFNPGIMSRLSSAMTDMGYRYFDWNVSSGDAGGTTDTKQIVENVTEGCSEHRLSVVLQHDIKDYSVAAVERIIIWGLNNGYTFRPLDQTSPEMHHAIAN